MIGRLETLSWDALSSTTYGSLDALEAKHIEKTMWENFVGSDLTSDSTSSSRILIGDVGGITCKCFVVDKRFTCEVLVAPKLRHLLPTQVDATSWFQLKLFHLRIFTWEIIINTISRDFMLAFVMLCYIASYLMTMMWRWIQKHHIKGGGGKMICLGVICWLQTSNRQGKSATREQSPSSVDYSKVIVYYSRLFLSNHPPNWLKKTSWHTGFEVK